MANDQDRNVEEAVRERIAQIISETVSGPCLPDESFRRAHRVDLLTAADLILAAIAAMPPPHLGAYKLDALSGSAGRKIIDGLKDTVVGNFTVTIMGQRWVPADAARPQGEPVAYLVKDDPELGDYLTRSKQAAENSDFGYVALYAAPAQPAAEAGVREALEPFALISSEGVVTQSVGHVTITTCAEYFHRAAAALKEFSK